MYPQPIAIIIFDIDGVIRDVAGSYRRALADTVEYFTGGIYRPSAEDIDQLKAEGVWNNDWQAAEELVYRQGARRGSLDYQQVVAFFQSRYRGPDPSHWTGYICHEPLLVDSTYFNQLTQARLPWGFFSGATRASALYALEGRLGLVAPPLVAMEDAPGKPDPTGLISLADQLAPASPVVYVGDTVADMKTVVAARSLRPDRRWFGVGVLPPHVLENPSAALAYRNQLGQTGADLVLDQVRLLGASVISQLLA